MNAVCLVAHPDDCVIFAWPFIEAHPEFTWTIVYLTYNKHDPRAKEADNFWQTKSIPTTFLGFIDDWKYSGIGELGFDPADAEHQICKALADAGLILTHNKDGDYGHIHHKFVNSCADKLATPKVYFASTFNYNIKYQVKESVNTLLWPIHREVIEGFQDRNTGLYILTEEAKQIL